jgi:high-affinity Fe2+/Pb2+ permease
MEENNKKGNILYGILGFLFPIAGLILYILFKDSQPEDAEIAIKGTVIGLIVGFVIGILLTVFILVFGIGLFSTMPFDFSLLTP